MAQKALVNGVAYDIKSGSRCLVNGVGYDIKKGRVLVNGVGYDITIEEASLVWKLNDTVTQPWEEFPASFTSKNFMGQTESYDIIRTKAISNGKTDVIYLQYYNSATSTGSIVYNFESEGWITDVMKNLTFEEPPTGNLLLWLQMNGTPQ